MPLARGIFFMYRSQAIFCLDDTIKTFACLFTDVFLSVTKYIFCLL